MEKIGNTRNENIPKRSVIAERAHEEALSAPEQFKKRFDEEMSEITRLTRANLEYPGQGFDADAEERVQELHKELDAVIEEATSAERQGKL